MDLGRIFWGAGVYIVKDSVSYTRCYSRGIEGSFRGYVIQLTLGSLKAVLRCTEAVWINCKMLSIRGREGSYFKEEGDYSTLNHSPSCAPCAVRSVPLGTQENTAKPVNPKPTQ